MGFLFRWFRVGGKIGWKDRWMAQSRVEQILTLESLSKFLQLFKVSWYQYATRETWQNDFEVVIRDLCFRTLELKREGAACQVRGKLSNIRPRPAFSILLSVFRNLSTLFRCFRVSQLSMQKKSPISSKRPYSLIDCSLDKSKLQGASSETCQDQKQYCLAILILFYDSSV